MIYFTEVMTNTEISTKKASILDFFKSIMLELKKVDWPTREKTIRFTAIVIIVSVAMGLFIGGLDILFTHAIEYVLALKK
jgi:preprotein translocase subunit SecE